MNCNEIRARLLAAQYGELPDAERGIVERHLAGCAACREESSQWREFRGLLDALRAPAVAVDLPRLYAQAAHRRERSVRRWRRAAWCAVAAAAAALVVVGMKLELRVGPSQVVLHWGGPPAAPPQGPDMPPATVPTPAAVPRVNSEELQLVKDLVRVLAQEVDTRDRRQQEELLRLQTRFETLLGRAFDRWASNERDVAALYAAQFRFQQKGEKGENQ
jgi:anti-sigma factor RsiW